MKDRVHFELYDSIEEQLKETRLSNIVNYANEK